MMEFIGYYWDGNDFVVIDKNGEKVTIAEAYVADIKFHGLDFEYTEDVVIEQTRFDEDV